MSSAFFRRPTDDSSSSSSDDVGSDQEDPPIHHTEESADEEAPTATTESLPSHGSVSLGDQTEASPTPVSNVDRHRTNLLHTLLEDFAKTRASQYLNETNPGSTFDRSSSMVQSLAERVYQQVAESLTLTGILPLASEGDNDRQTRATYLMGLEKLAASSSQNRDLAHGQSPLQLLPSEQLLTVAKIGKQQQARPLHLSKHSFSSLALQTRSHLPSPYSGLSFSHSEVHRSHYDSSFQQLRLLGKGGFGRVYHAYNIFDKKEYAVKKIPLSPRLSQRYRESGHQELEHVLREVQALAQLEHNNVVRYHATWIEEPRSAPSTNAVYQLREHAPAAPDRKLITDGSRHRMPGVIQERSVASDCSDGVVFGADSRPTTPVREVEEVAQELVWSVNNTEPDASSARPSEIFTDGNARSNTVEDSAADDSVYVLHVQMSVYPLTLAHYLAPGNSIDGTSVTKPRHCFHLVPALRILLGILCGLEYIHAGGLIHRDIKPSNIFISTLDLSTTALIPDGYHDVGSCAGCQKSNPFFVNPRIGDFGLVAELARQSPGDTPTRGRQFTKVVGTEFYRPPRPQTDPAGSDDDQSNADEKVDVFAIGVILIELLWPCATSTERMHVLRDVQHGLVPAKLAEKIDREGHQPGTSEFMVECISGMIHQDPQRRWGCDQVKNRAETLIKRCEANNIATTGGSHSGMNLDDKLSRVKSLDDASEVLPISDRAP